MNHPVTQDVVWSYDGGPVGLFSLTCGSNQRLANGNTLITESDAGRAIEVTPAEIVWEYVTPHRAGNDDELIATLFGSRAACAGSSARLDRSERRELNGNSPLETALAPTCV